MPGAAASTGPGITNPQMGVGGFPPPVGGESQQQKWKGERIPGWLGYIRDYTIPIYIGIILNHDKDFKKKTTSISWKVRPVFFFVAQMERLLRGDILYKVGLLQLALKIGNWGSGYDLTCGGYNSFITGRGSPCKDRSGLLGIEFAFFDPTQNW